MGGAAGEIPVAVALAVDGFGDRFGGGVGGRRVECQRRSRRRGLVGDAHAVEGLVSLEGVDGTGGGGEFGNESAAGGVATGAAFGEVWMAEDVDADCGDLLERRTIVEAVVF